MLLAIIRFCICRNILLPIADVTYILMQLTAYHESGHAVVAFNTEGAHPIHKATIMPRGSALGMVTQLPSDDETSISKKQLLARLDVCMGGRVAEELIFGQDQITTGASSDLKTATELAHYMVLVVPSQYINFSNMVAHNLQKQHVCM